MKTYKAKTPKYFVNSVINLQAPPTKSLISLRHLNLMYT